MNRPVPMNEYLAGRAESMARFLMKSRKVGHAALCEYCEDAIVGWADEIIARNMAGRGND